MTTFERSLVLPVSREFLRDWHLRRGVLDRLGPPWVAMQRIRPDPKTQDTTRVFDVRQGGMWLRWAAHRESKAAPQQLTDKGPRGPFRRWEHTHRFEFVDSATSRLVDQVEYEVPLGSLGAGAGVETDIDRMFRYRHRVTLGDLRTHALYADRAPLRIAVTGARGLLGSQLMALLRTGGHEVIALVRAEQVKSENEVRWGPSGVTNMHKLEGLDAMVHLAGARVAGRWNASTRKRTAKAREIGTRAIVEAIGKLTEKPRCFVSASSIGFYGDTGETVVDESGLRGEGADADACAQWEQEARRAEDHGVRTTCMRIGVVMDPRGGALASLLPVFETGMGGVAGTGRQLVSWVALDDVICALVHVIHDTTVSGPVNVTGPVPVTQRELSESLGRVLERSTVARAPDAAIRAMHGDMGRESVLMSTGARPNRLLGRGYAFRTTTLEETLRHCLGRMLPSVSES
jgi:uncharacterized protein (TIGR01777 family)